MREILFRGKCKDTGKWVYGNYNTVSGSHYINSTHGDLGDIDYGYGFTEVSPTTIGQYWKKDKSGRKIFSGDKVKVHQFLFDGNEVEKESIAIVVLGEDGFDLNFIEGDFIRSHTGYNDDGEDCIVPAAHVYGLHEESFEITGTIHDEEEK